jgi:DeoR family transcriptional regulator, fructose operon transcriptional repressor
MKQSKKVVDARRHLILEALHRNSDLNADDLADMLKVSALTIRRDFQYLEDHKLITRHYGGAKPIETLPSANKKVDLIETQKNLIAKKAAEFVEDGDTIFINTSSTALLMLKYIKNKNVNIITNNANVLNIKTDYNLNIFLSGGELREPKNSMVGEFAYANISRVTANKTFIGCSGISSRVGLTTAVLAEVPINELMLKNCMGPRFVLADGSKVGHDHSFVSSSLERVNYFITDDTADQEELNQYRAQDLEVIVVSNY